MLLDKNDGLFRPFRLGLDETTARSICFTTNQGIMPWLTKNHQILNKEVVNREVTTNKLTVRDAIKIQKENESSAGATVHTYLLPMGIE